MERVLLGKGILADIRERTAHISPEGSVVVAVIDRESEKSKTVLGVLSRFLKVYPVYISDEPTFSFSGRVKLDSEVRIVYAVGGESAVEVGKCIANRYSLPLIAVLTSVDGARLLCTRALLYDNFGTARVEVAKAPDMVFADTTLIDDIAQAYGAVISRTVALADSAVAFAIEGEERKRGCGILLNSLLECIEFERRGDGEGVILSAIKASLGVEQSGVDIDGATAVAIAYRLLKLKRGESVKSVGETAVAVAPTVLALYRLAISVPLVQSVFVPDNNATVDKMYALLGVNPVRGIRMVEEYDDYSALERKAYCIKAYRPELLKKCTVYLKTAQFGYERFKRLYKDRGFSYNNYIDEEDLKQAFFFAPEMRGKLMLLSLIKQIGYLR